MKIVATGNTRPVIDNGSTFQAEQASKARAVQAFNSTGKSQIQTQSAPQPQQQVVQSQNNIQPEEMSAIMQVPKPQLIPESQSQVDTPTTVEDTVQTQAVQPDPKEAQLSAKFAQLAKREAQQRRERQQRDLEFKSRDEALKAREAALNQQQFDPNQYVSKAKLRDQTLEALAEANVSYDQIVQQALQQPAQDPRTTALIKQMDAKITKLEASLEQQSKSAVEQQQAGYQAAVKQIRNDVINLVSSDPAFETIKATKSVNDVVELIERTFKQDGVVLSVEDASQQVEDYLVEEGAKLAQISKIQARLKANQVAPNRQQAVQTAQTQQKQPMKTLTNATSSTRQLSARERAVMAFNGTLKS